jgi:parvulin-like peptidyl-prolyl isomerase
MMQGLRAHLLARGLVVVLLATSCRPAEPADPVILALGDASIRRSDFERHLAGLAAQGLDASDPAVRRSVLDSFLEERVLVLEARSRGLLKPGAGPEEEQLAAQQLLSEAARARASVSDAEIAAYFAEHAAELAQPETVVLRQILVPTENEARDVRRRLSKAPRSFEMLAQTRSRAPEASAGGLMGSFTRGQLPSDLEKAAFALAPQGLSDPVQTPLGYHVLRADSHTLARDRNLEECREEIRRVLLQAKSADASREAVKTLLERARVNYEAAQSRP